MALADVFDAMMSQRVYKTAFAAEDVRLDIVGKRGTHFDPDVVDAFIARYEAFVEIARQHADAL